MAVQQQSLHRAPIGTGVISAHHRAMSRQHVKEERYSIQAPQLRLFGMVFLHVDIWTSLTFWVARALTPSADKISSIRQKGERRVLLALPAFPRLHILGPFS
jgi:hypothetical protein